jgi:CheY-like chemotaxis protein
MNPKGRVLIVDDEPGIRRAFSRCLRALGWTVTEAEDPDAAASLYGGVDVVLTDWDMPAGGGERVLREAGRPCVVQSGGEPPVPHLTKPAPVDSIDRALLQAMRRA